MRMNSTWEDLVPAASLGNRLRCGACDARFYDLNRAEPICPKCKTAYTGPAAPRRVARQPEPEPVELDGDEDDEEDDDVEELDLDTDRIPPAMSGTDDDSSETGDPALDELDEAELPDDSLGGFDADDSDDSSGDDDIDDIDVGVDDDDDLGDLDDIDDVDDDDDL